MKDLNFKRIIAYANYLILFVDDKDKQTKIIEILNNYSKRLPDFKWVDKIQEKILKKKTDYYDISEFLMKDIEKTKKTNDNLTIIKEMLNEINLTINPSIPEQKPERTPAKKIADLSSWS